MGCLFLFLRHPISSLAGISRSNQICVRFSNVFFNQQFGYGIIVALGFAFTLYTAYRDPALECWQDEQLRNYDFIHSSMVASRGLSYNNPPSRPERGEWARIAHIRLTMP